PRCGGDRGARIGARRVRRRVAARRRRAGSAGLRPRRVPRRHRVRRAHPGADATAGGDHGTRRRGATLMRVDARRRLWFAALLLLPIVFRDDLSRYALARVGAFAVAATGVAIVSGLAGQISLGHAGLMAAGAFTSAGLAVNAHWPFAAAWIAGTLLAAVVGLVFGIPSLRVRGQYLALATLGGGFIIWQIVRE